MRIDAPENEVESVLAALGIPNLLQLIRLGGSTPDLLQSLRESIPVTDLAPSVCVVLVGENISLLELLQEMLIALRVIELLLHERGISGEL